MLRQQHPIPTSRSSKDFTFHKSLTLRTNKSKSNAMRWIFCFPNRQSNDVKIADHELAQLVFSHDFAEINTSQSIIIEHFCHHISDFAEINTSIGARA